MESTHTLLLRYAGDICTKARRTRARFVRRLLGNVRDALASAGIEGRVDGQWSRTFIEVEDLEALEVLARVFGVHSLSPVERATWSTLEELVDRARRFFMPGVAGRTFAVRARRAIDRARIPFRSVDVERQLGTALLDGARGVDLENPEVTAWVEIHPDRAYFFHDKIPGPGGLPIGVEGRALALVSGGFDSAVAAWFLLKRGVALDYLFFNLGGIAHEQGVFRVMKVLADRWSYGDRPRLHQIDFRPVVAALRERTAPRYWQVLLKRLMLRVAEQVATDLRCPALVTGEAVGQVSSQTLQNLAVLSEATRMTVLRPLVGFNKDEIIDRARHLGTYELSAAVAEYCAILPRRPVTHARLAATRAEEEKLDLPALDDLAASRRTLDLRALDPGAMPASPLAVQEIPADAIAVDLRSATAYKAWHYPGAIHLAYPRALRSFGSFQRDRSYVLYCEVGLKSAHLAELLREQGYDTYHYHAGVRELMRVSVDGDPLRQALLAPAHLE